MKKPTIQKLWPLLCAVLILSACQKETSTTQEQQSSENKSTRASGVVADDPALMATVPVIMSSEFQGSPNALGAKGGGKGNSSKQTDTDGDGIPDTNDTCPTQKETFNGYQDSDGCPDSVPPATSRDATPPAVSISSPANGTTVSGTVNITVSASDNISVSSVSLSVDGTIIGTKTSAPYSFSWNTTSVADGMHTVTAKAYDAAGNSASNSLSVTTKNTTVLPPSTSLPSNFQLATPTPAYQGGEGACVPFAIGYAARSIEQYYKTGASSYSYSSNIFSPEFLYNQTKIDVSCGSGTGILTTLEFLKSKGVSTWQSMPYTSESCSLLPSSSQLAEALNYKITSYSSVYTNDLTAIKTMLTNKHPLIIAFTTDNSFYGAGPGFIWKSWTSTGPFHCVAIVGYDDAKHAVKIMNSWGTSWGEGGYSWIDYNFLSTLTGKAYVMSL
jgi:hypothetical protein